MLERERFDVLHLHEPMTPAICVAALSFARCPVVATFHASGELGWMRYALYFWGALMDRIDHRIAVSEQARDSAARWLPGAYDVVPNGVLIPPEADAGNREHRIAFVGRHEPRKGLQVLLRAWPTVHARDRRAAAADRRRPPGGRAAPAAARRVRRRHRRARLPEPGRADRRAVVGEGARRAVDRRRELRHGAHARLRVRVARGRVRHPRATATSRRPRPASRCRPAIRCRSRRRSSRSSRTSRGGGRWARRRASSRRRSTGGRRSRGGLRASTSSSPDRLVSERAREDPPEPAGRARRSCSRRSAPRS